MTTANPAMPLRAAGRRPRVEPLLVAAALAAGYLIVQPFSADLATQVYRTDLFKHVGFTLWNSQWFAGHHTPGYSVLFPPLAALLGPRLVGALSAVAAAVLFERLTYARWGNRARVGAVWFGAASATNLFTGRLTFALGVAIGLGALLAAQRDHGRLAAVLAALCSLGSPIAGLFLALAAGIDGVVNRRRVTLVVAATAFATALLLETAFPEGGVQPFGWSSYWPTVAFAAVVLVFVPREERAIRWGALLYGLACTAAYLLATPMGSNAVRLGTLFGGPLIACLLWRRRTVALAALALPLLYWQWLPPVLDVSAASGDPSVKASFYAPLTGYLSRVKPTGRIEIPPTHNHWETVYVAPRFALARGWERQLDTKYNDLFYQRRLDPIDYRTWLSDNAVQYVAIPRASLDYAAVLEAQLVQYRVPYLVPVWSDANWHVYRYKYAVPLVTGAATLVSASPSGFALHATQAGVVDTRFRYTPYWKIEHGAGCIEPAPGGLTRVLVRRPGPLRIDVEFSPSRLVSDAPRCRGGAAF